MKGMASKECRNNVMLWMKRNKDMRMNKRSASKNAKSREDLEMVTITSSNNPRRMRCRSRNDNFETINQAY